MINLHLELLRYRDELLLSTAGDKKQLFDPIRQKYVRADPEELVRQLAIHCLLREYNYSKKLISVEKQIIVNGLRRRFDILVYDRSMEPWMLVECKAPTVPITNETFFQLAQYNLSLGVDYLWVTNGRNNYCCRMDYERNSYDFVSSIPNFEGKK